MVTLPAATTTITSTGAPIILTITSTSTVVSTQSVTATVTTTGYAFDGYDVYCNSGTGSGSFTASTTPSYNFEDCASQCFSNPGGIDCLGVTYTAPAVPFRGFDGSLQPGTCTFYEFVTSAVPANGVVLGVFENTFAG